MVSAAANRHASPSTLKASKSEQLPGVFSSPCHTLTKSSHFATPIATRASYDPFSGQIPDLLLECGCVLPAVDKLRPSLWLFMEFFQRSVTPESIDHAVKFALLKNGLNSLTPS
jgi:hypothetical protein